MEKTRSLLVVGAGSEIFKYWFLSWRGASEISFLSLVFRENRVDDDFLESIRQKLPLIRMSVHEIRDSGGNVSHGKQVEEIVNCSVYDYALFPIGSLILDKNIVTSNDVHALYTANFTIPFLFSQELIKENPNCSLLFFGSVASVIGKPSNSVYGGVKACLKVYAEGLIGNEEVMNPVKYILFGPIDTAMAHNNKAVKYLKANKLAVSKFLSAIMDQKSTNFIIYHPKVWGLIMAILRYLPANLKRRLLR